jgi:serine/threonine-protein kinase HipA
MRKCLFCLKNLPDSEVSDFHSSCSQQFFGSKIAPELPYSLNNLAELAKNIVGQRITVTGVQPKLSLAFEKNIRAGISRLTLVGLWGDYILKPPNQNFPELVENEQVTMKMAAIFGIQTVPFSLIRLQSGELSYITKRIDRHRSGKLPMEDFCQLSERLTEYKYRGSVEQVAKIIRRFSTNQGLDVANFFEIVLFCFITGNADMHLKNYSMITTQDHETRLSPFYDLVATKLAMPTDLEDAALTINGKKNKLNYKDFQAFSENSGLPDAVFKKIMRRFQQKIPAAIASLEHSFLSKNTKKAFADLISKQAKILWDISI